MMCGTERILILIYSVCGVRSGICFSISICVLNQGYREKFVCFKDSIDEMSCKETIPKI